MPPQPTDWGSRISEAVTRLSDELRNFASNLLNRVDRNESRLDRQDARLDKLEAKLDKLYDAQSAEAVILAQLPHDTAVEVRSEIDAAFGKLQLHMSESIERRRDTFVIASEREGGERGETSKKIPLVQVDEDGRVTTRTDIIKKVLPWVIAFASAGVTAAHLIQSHGR